VVLPGPAPAQTPLPKPRLVGYYASWSAYGPFKVAQIPADRLTHVSYAFATVTPRHELALGDPAIDPANIGELAKLKRRYPHLRVMLAVGGQGSGSRHFSAMAATDASRRTFATSCARLLFDRYPAAFDGLTIDWEYPGGDGHGVPGVPDDRDRFTVLMKTLRHTLDARGQQLGRRPLLAATLPATQALLRRFDPAAMAKHVDYIDFMTFDYPTGGGRTGHNAPLQAPSTGGESVSRSVQTLLEAGVPPERINVAMPFFGRAWQQVAAKTNQGLGQAGKVDTMDTTYRALSKTALKGGYRRHWDTRAKVPFLTGSPANRWISYDDAASLAAKGQYVRDHRLGGAFIWHLGADDPGRTLLNAVWHSLKGSGSTPLGR
jgi:chitinase